MNINGRTYTLVGEPSDDLVLVFHGSKQNGAKHRAFTGRMFDALPARVAYLDGYRGNWNDARRESAFPARRANIDDVAFTRGVIEELKPSRVFAVGYSNGGQMVMRLAHEVPSLLAGAVVIAATMPAPESFLLTGAPPSPMPMLLIHGTKDPIIAYGGGELSWWARALFKVGGRSLSAPETAAYFAARNGVTTAPTVTRLSPRVERSSYGSVELYTVHGGGHTIPGPHSAPFILGRTTHDINTADLITEFFHLGKPQAPTQHNHHPTT
jgi:polyhydroxybutyrate depolymerase